MKNVQPWKKKHRCKVWECTLMQTRSQKLFVYLFLMLYILRGGRNCILDITGAWKKLNYQKIGLLCPILNNVIHFQCYIIYLVVYQPWYRCFWLDETAIGSLGRIALRAIFLCLCPLSRGCIVLKHKIVIFQYLCF